MVHSVYTVWLRFLFSLNQCLRQKRGSENGTVLFVLLLAERYFLRIDGRLAPFETGIRVLKRKNALSFFLIS